MSPVDRYFYGQERMDNNFYVFFHLLTSNTTVRLCLGPKEFFNPETSKWSSAMNQYEPRTPRNSWGGYNCGQTKMDDMYRFFRSCLALTGEADSSWLQLSHLTSSHLPEVVLSEIHVMPSLGLLSCVWHYPSQWTSGHATAFIFFFLISS